MEIYEIIQVKTGSKPLDVAKAAVQRAAVICPLGGRVVLKGFDREFVQAKMGQKINDQIKYHYPDLTRRSLGCIRSMVSSASTILVLAS